MTDEQKKVEMHKALFSSLVMMLSSSAMQQLGKLVNPMTNKTEVNLEAAQMTIDMLDMLRERTKGNLDKDEDKMMNESGQGQKTEEQEPAEETESPPADDSQDETEDKKDDPTDPKDPKYHKSYG